MGKLSCNRLTSHCKVNLKEKLIVRLKVKYSRATALTSSKARLLLCVLWKSTLAPKQIFERDEPSSLLSYAPLHVKD